MWIPTKLYEALPAIYFAIGVAFISGALYVGVNDTPMIVYLILGSLCIGAGTAVADRRSKARSERDRSRT